MKQRIESLVHGGNVTIEAIGYSGPACESATREIEQALGVEVERTKKPEFYQRTTKAATQNA